MLTISNPFFLHLAVHDARRRAAVRVARVLCFHYCVRTYKISSTEAIEINRLRVLSEAAIKNTGSRNKHDRLLAEIARTVTSFDAAKDRASRYCCVTHART